jgi:hypothetical protein
MHGLYRPHGPDGASREGPSGIVRCDALMRGQLKRWQYILTDSCGVSVKRALLRENLETLPSVSLELFSRGNLAGGGRWRAAKQAAETSGNPRRILERGDRVRVTAARPSPDS